jgi:deazaflavin-dependent oxidoreductase (nitroreductase family)
MDGAKYVIIASKGGADTNPQWYGNLVANPNASAEVGDETLAVLAIEAKGAEHDRLYAQHAAQYPQFNDYKAKTSRVIPVFVLERTAA